MLIGLGKDMTSINFEFSRSKVKVTKVNFVKKKVKTVSTQYLENY